MEFFYSDCEANRVKMKQFVEALHRAGVTCMAHLGKSVLPCQLFKTCLSTEQRERWVAVLDTFDPARIFDGGKVKLRDMFDLRGLGSVCPRQA